MIYTKHTVGLKYFLHEPSRNGKFHLLMELGAKSPKLEIIHMSASLCNDVFNTVSDQIRNHKIKRKIAENKEMCHQRRGPNKSAPY